ncbi:helix-turn-helix domain-containing protein [Mycobacterium sp. 155]|uniref:helix-turn-helix domain-containing protein n=1 Tax=Mycobacterium sp. 155 TaxID=1157943 RepID=UPI00036ECAB2|nr:helix-turn-helix domain-containing protein [Mycobacterium sp. 155]
MTYLNTAEAGEQLGVCSTTVRRMIQREELKGFRVARQYRTTQEAVDAYKAKSPVASAPVTDLAANSTTVIERLAEVIMARPKWLFDRAVPAPAGWEPLHGALAGTPA